MNRLIKSLLLTLLIPLLFVPNVIATEMKSGENVVLPVETVIEGDYFAAGDSVTISGTINGDLYVAGGNIVIEGTIKGDVLAAGGNITVRGTIEQDMRMVGGNIIVTGSIGRNITIAGGSINITDAAEVQGNIVTAGGTIQIFTAVPGSVTIAGGNVEIGNQIVGDVFAAVGNINITPSGSIGGNLTYYSEEELNLPQGATISGEIVRKEYPERPELDDEQRENIVQAGRAAAFGSKILNIVSAFIVGSLLIAFFPKYTSHITNRVSNSFWKSMGLGLMFLIVAPIVTIILLITVVGIPLAMILLFAYFLSIFVAKIFVSLVIGRKLLFYFKKEYNHYIVLLVGLISYLILTSIPLIGWLVTLVAVLTGIGAVYMGKKDYYEEAKAKKII